MSITTTDNTDDVSPGDAPIETIRELEPELRRLAQTDLPIAPHAQNAIDRLEEADRDE